MQVARIAAVAMSAVFLGGCPTEANPTYCDEATPCSTGVCNLETHMCGPAPDGAPDAPVDAPPGACETAGGRIVFTTTRDGDTEIATVLADGSQYRQLTSNGVEDAWPLLSPDGARIAWWVGGELWVMNADGTSPHAVSEGGVIDLSYRWSSDSDRLVFAGSGADVYVVNADGSGLANVTMDVAGSNDRPAWSPDGTRIAFRQNDSATDHDLYTINADGTNPTRIVDVAGESDIFYVRWSPDGNLISYRAASSLWTVAPNGSSPEVLADGGTRNEWSHDAARLVWDDGADIWTIRVDGTALTNLTNGGIPATGSTIPWWSPDDARIVFATRRDGDSEVYVMNADGSDPVNLTNDIAHDLPGNWAPCPP
jgi:Tol biopolymer transport system component